MADRFLFEPQALQGVVLIKPRKFGDARGYFLETYRRDAYAAAGVSAEFIQDNQSLSARRFTVRGLHFQRPPFAQGKLVRVLAGRVFDVAVDLRPESPTAGLWCGAELTADGAEQLFVPRGFAHGFCTLEENTVVAYKVDAAYAPEYEGGIRWDDPAIGISWPVPPGEASLSPRDRELPAMADIDTAVFEGSMR